MQVQSSLKSLKEASVTGHNGYNHPFQILWVCCSTITGSLLYGMIRIMLFKNDSLSSSTRTTATTTIYLFLLEAVVVWLPMILAQTIYLFPYATFIMIGQLLMAIFCIIITMIISTRRNGEQQESTMNEFTTTNQQQQQQQQSPSPPSKHVLPYLTLYRSSILYLTFIAILGVDFPNLYPRRYCKTEILGYGFMDIGAASFAISAGLVSGKQYVVINNNNMTMNTSHQRSMMIIRPFVHTVPLIIIGLIRIITNHGLEYQQHVSEYGIHWNFFFTLGVMTFLPTIWKIGIRRKREGKLLQMSKEPSWILPTICMVVYQFALSILQWQQFIVNAPRQYTELQEWIATTTTTNNNNNNDKVTSFGTLTWIIQSSYPYIPTITNFFIANREGILGCIGYLSLYSIGEWIGYYWLWKRNDYYKDDRSLTQQSKATTTTTTTTTPTTASTHNVSMNHDLLTLALILWSLHFIIHYGLDIPVSRRTTNLGFCTWALAHNILLLYGLQQVEYCLSIIIMMIRWTRTQQMSSSAVLYEPSPSMMIVPTIWNLVNKHGLVMFLIANLLTGLVNLTIPTLTTNSLMALGIVFGYICLVGIAAIAFDKIWKKLRNKPNQTKSKSNTVNQKTKLN